MIELPAELTHYKLTEFVGQGSFGSVYRAVDTTSGLDVALKILHPELCRDSSVVDLFIREAETLSRLDHPSIIKVHQILHADSKWIMVMEYLPNGSLADKIETGASTYSFLKLVLNQVATGLEYMHEKGIVHCDIKPTNLLFKNHDQIVITDFGGAQLAKASQTAAATTNQRRMGTPSYMAPELWEGRRISAATDVYALGCVAYEMLTGKKLFDGTLTEVIYQHTQVGYKLLYSSSLRNSSGAIPLLKAALLSNPDERIQSPREFVDKLVQIFGEGDNEIGDELPLMTIGVMRPPDFENLRDWWHEMLRNYDKYRCFAFLLCLPSDANAIQYLTDYGNELDILSGDNCLVIALSKTEIRRAGFDRRIWEYATNEQIEQGYSAAVARHLRIPFREFPCLVVFEDIRSPKRIVFSFKDKSVNEISSEIRQIFTVIEVSDTNHRRMSPLALLKRYKASQLQKKASDTIFEISKKTFEAAIEAWLKATIK